MVYDATTHWKQAKKHDKFGYLLVENALGIE